MGKERTGQRRGRQGASGQGGTQECRRKKVVGMESEGTRGCADKEEGGAVPCWGRTLTLLPISPPQG